MNMLVRLRIGAASVGLTLIVAAAPLTAHSGDVVAGGEGVAR